MAKNNGELAAIEQFEPLVALRDLGVDVSADWLAAYASANQIEQWDTQGLIDHADRIRSFEYQPTNSPDDLMRAIEEKQAEYVSDQVRKIIELRDRTASLIEEGVAAVQPVNFRAAGAAIGSRLFPI